MLEFVRLKDFQSHVDNTLTFSPGFNIICGPSGNGKSSVIRAIEYLSFNNVGNAEVRWPDATSYHIEVGVDGHIVYRDKGEKINQYQVDQNEPLVDVNRDVPNDVSKVLNISAIPLEASVDTRVQFSDQMDAPFMLSEKDSIKMKFLNVLSGTNAVDLAAKKAVALTKENTKSIKEHKAKINALQCEADVIREQLDEVKRVNQYVKSRYADLTKLEEMRKPLYNLKSLSDRVFTAFQKVRLFKEAVNAINLDDVMDKINTYIKLRELNIKYTQAKAAAGKLKVVKQQLNCIQVDDLANKLQRLSDLLTIAGRYNTLKSQVNQHKTNKQRISDTLITYKNNYVNVLKEVGLCPVCGNELTTECLDSVVKNL